MNFLSGYMPNSDDGIIHSAMIATFDYDVIMIIVDINSCQLNGLAGSVLEWQHFS